MFVGLTGGIGSGKSTVAAIFKTLCIPVLNADAVARTLMETNPTITESIKNTFGEAAYTNNQLDRKFLSEKVFNDSYSLSLLNEIVHPAVIQFSIHWMKQQDAPYVLKEAALIFESGSANGLDYIIGVTAPLSLKTQRIALRDNISEKDIQARMDKQLSDSIKMKLCDYVINNDDQQALIPQVLALHQQFLKLSSEMQ